MNRSASPARDAGAARMAGNSTHRSILGTRRCAAVAIFTLLATGLGLGGTACGGTASDAQAGDPAAASADGGAVYSVTFTGVWTADVTPDGMPDGAHFSPLIGAVHNAAVAFLEAGGKATPGIESMAERGRTAALTEEIEAAGENALRVLVKDSGSGATGSSSFEAVTVTVDHPRITLLSMIAPSPDWFVGVFALSLRDAEGGWVENLTVDLFPWDAGTEEGDGLSFDNAATSPQGTITGFRGMGPFSDAPIATLTFTRSDGTGG